MTKEDLKKIYLDENRETLSKEIIETSCRLIKEFAGLFPYREQIEAAKKIYKGKIVDQKTGEGKTISILLASLLLLRDKRKVYIVTSNEYLKERDYSYSFELISFLGFNSKNIVNSIGLDNRDYEEGNIFYATGSGLIFDYLRGIKAFYDFAIIDEIDYILVEEAGTSISVSTGETEIEAPVGIYIICRKILPLLKVKHVLGFEDNIVRNFDYQYKHDILVDNSNGNILITTKGYRFLEKLGKDLVSNNLFMEAFYASLKAELLLKKRISYDVIDEKIHITDLNSGRSNYYSSLDFCTQTAIEIKENISVSKKDVMSNTCSLSVFFMLFNSFSGISGTSNLVPYDFSILYEKDVVSIKEHSPNRRKEIYKYFDSNSEKLEYALKIINNDNAPKLLIFNSDRNSNIAYSFFKKELINKEVMLLDNFSLDKETKYIDRSSLDNTVLISSKIVGRGTDIKVNSKNGLTVILLDRMLSFRSERQVIGRTGRNGSMGRCYILTSMDDEIFLYANRRVKRVTEKEVKRIQKLHESNSFEERKFTFLLNRIFLIIDDAIRNRLSEFNNISDLYRYLGLGYKKYKDISVNKKALIHIYILIRPWMQKNIFRYMESNGSLLYDDMGFNYILKELTIISDEVIENVVTIYLKEALNVK